MTTPTSVPPAPRWATKTLAFTQMMWRYLPLVYLARILRGMTARQWKIFAVVFTLTFLLGTGMAVAADDNAGSADMGWSSFVPLQDYSHGGGKTLVEDIPTSRYFIDDEVDGNIVNAVTAAGNGLADTLFITTVSIAWVVVAIISWLLGTSDVGNDTFNLTQLIGNASAETMGWLFPTCLAIAAVAVWVDHRRERTGLNGIFTVLILAVIATGFTLFPGVFVKGLETVRAGGQAVVTSVMPEDQAGTQLPFEYGNPDYSQNTDTEAFTRQVTDTVWRAAVVTPWCMVEFGSIDVCQKYGKEMLTRASRDERTDDVIKKQMYKDESIGGKNGDAGQWVHGEMWTQRLGMAVLGLVVCLLMVFLVATLVFSAVIALVQSLLLLVMGVLFLVLGMIPGPPRQWCRNWAVALSAAVLANIVSMLLLVVALGAITTIFSSPDVVWFKAYGLSILTLLAALGIRSMIQRIVDYQSDATGAGAGGRIMRMLMMRQLFRVTNRSHSKTAAPTGAGKGRSSDKTRSAQAGPTGAATPRRGSRDVVSTRISQANNRRQPDAQTSTARGGAHGAERGTAAETRHQRATTRAGSTAGAQRADRAQHTAGRRQAAQGSHAAPQRRGAPAQGDSSSRTETAPSHAAPSRAATHSAPPRRGAPAQGGSSSRIETAPSRAASSRPSTQRDRNTSAPAAEAPGARPAPQPKKRPDARIDAASGLRGGPRTVAPRQTKPNQTESPRRARQTRKG